MQNVIEYLKEFLIRAPVILFALTVHEVSHGYAAHLMGDDTAKNLGRLTMNPLKHLDPVGALCMMLFRFGWAKPVPINPRNFSKYRLGICLTSIAGPLSNLIVAFISTMLYCAIQVMGITNLTLQVLSDLLQMSMFMNLSLCLFNLIPIPPLDGSKIFITLLPGRIAAFVLRYERFGMILLIVLIYSGIITGFLTKAILWILTMFIKLFLFIF